jgi:ABC-type transport system involved in multi-copper enzyme maturation permease subunit
MLLGPIFTFELVTSVRRLRYFLVRVVYALILLTILWISYIESPLYRAAPGELVSHQEMARFANDFFNVFAATQLVAVVLLTPAMIAGTIAQERERRTIEYLFASQLTNVEIVLAKFAARLLHVGCELLVGLPILALAMLMGGIAPELLAQTFAVTLATLVAIGALSISLSVWAKRSRDAVTSAYLILLAFLLVPPLAAAIGSQAPWLSWLADAGEALVEIDPFVVLLSGFSGGSVSAWSASLPLLVCYPLFTLLCLAWSVLRVRTVYRKSAGKAARRRRFSLRLWRPRMGAYPMLWKEMFAETAALRFGLLARIALLLLIAAVIVPGALMFIDYVFYETGGRDQAGRGLLEYVCGVTVAVGLLGLLMVLVRAAGSVTSEKERDCWTSLISTPLSPAQIVWAKIAGSVYGARLLAAPLVLLYGMAVLVRTEVLWLIPVMAGTWGVLALYVAALGVLFSLWCRTSVRAMAGSVATAVFFGGGYLLCCTPLFIGGGNDSEMLILAPCIPFLLYMPGDIWHEAVVANSAGFSASRIEAKLVLAYVLGMGAYFAAGVVLSMTCVEGFESFAGRRIGQGYDPRRRVAPGPPRANSPLVQATVVQEEPPAMGSPSGQAIE